MPKVASICNADATFRYRFELYRRNPDRLSARPSRDPQLPGTAPAQRSIVLQGTCSLDRARGELVIAKVGRNIPERFIAVKPRRLAI